MRWTKLQQGLRILAVGSVLVLAACGGGDKSPTGPGPGPGSAGDGVVAGSSPWPGSASSPSPRTSRSRTATPTRFTGGGMRFYDDGSWEFAVAIQNDFGDTRFDNAGWYEQQGGALWFEVGRRREFQGTIDQDGVIAIDYDYCQNGQTDIQLGLRAVSRSWERSRGSRGIVCQR